MEYVSFGVGTAFSIKLTVFWDGISCSLVARHQRTMRMETSVLSETSVHIYQIILECVTSLMTVNFAAIIIGRCKTRV